jgi:hypothetical protein
MWIRINETQFRLENVKGRGRLKNPTHRQDGVVPFAGSPTCGQFNLPENCPICGQQEQVGKKKIKASFICGKGFG